jgi:hypothetical protein
LPYFSCGAARNPRITRGGEEQHCTKLGSHHRPPYYYQPVIFRAAQGYSKKTLVGTRTNHSHAVLVGRPTSREDSDWLMPYPMGRGWRKARLPTPGRGRQSGLTRTGRDTLARGANRTPIQSTNPEPIGIKASYCGWFPGYPPASAVLPGLAPQRVVVRVANPCIPQCTQADRT